jgi:hypothetical protein
MRIERRQIVAPTRGTRTDAGRKERFAAPACERIQDGAARAAYQSN